MRYPESCVVLDCIDSWSLSPVLLKDQIRIKLIPYNIHIEIFIKIDLTWFSKIGMIKAESSTSYESHTFAKTVCGSVLLKIERTQVQISQLMLFLTSGFNPFKPNRISHCSQLDQSISVLRVVGWYFSFFFSNFKRNFCKQTSENLIRRRILRRLIWFCTVCWCSTKRTLGDHGLGGIVRIKLARCLFSILCLGI